MTGKVDNRQHLCGHAAAGRNNSPSGGGASHCEFGADPDMGALNCPAQYREYVPAAAEAWSGPATSPRNELCWRTVTFTAAWQRLAVSFPPTTSGGIPTRCWLSTASSPSIAGIPT